MRKRGMPKPVVLSSVADILKRDLAKGLISPAQASETRRQQKEFERNRTMIERRFSGLFVAYAGGHRYVGNSIAEVFSQVRAVDATLLLYLEQIPWTERDSMAYGVTRFDPKHGLPTIEVRVVGKDRKWRTIEKECRFIIDSGSNLTFIESRHLKGMKIEYLGSVIGQTASGTVAQNVFSGPILQFRGINDKGERMEFSCEEPFVIQSPGLLGGSAFNSTGVCVSLDYRKKTVRITRGKPRSITSKY